MLTDNEISGSDKEVLVACAVRPPRMDVTSLTTVVTRGAAEIAAPTVAVAETVAETSRLIPRRDATEPKS